VDRRKSWSQALFRDVGGPLSTKRGKSQAKRKETKRSSKKVKLCRGKEKKGGLLFDMGVLCSWSGGTYKNGVQKKAPRSGRRNVYLKKKREGRLGLSAKDSSDVRGEFQREKRQRGGT